MLLYMLLHGCHVYIVAARHGDQSSKDEVILRVSFNEELMLDSSCPANCHNRLCCSPLLCKAG